MPSQHLEQIRVRATHPALYGLADKMRRVGKRGKESRFYRTLAERCGLTFKGFDSPLLPIGINDANC